METLVFQLQAPLSAWGDVAVGEYRPTADYPSQSAILGLLAAALGIRRDEEQPLQLLHQGYQLAMGVLSAGRLLRDYQTAQVPSRADLKKRPQATRRDELSVPKQDLNTILSTRDYRQDAATLVAIRTASTAPYTLSMLSDALKQPRFVLYLGRKSCPLAAPVYPIIFTEKTIKDSFDAYLQHHPTQLSPQYSLQKIAWGDDLNDTSVGVTPSLVVKRKDQVITRQGWLFADRNEHIALLSGLAE